MAGALHAAQGALDAVCVPLKKLAKSTGKATWIAATSFLILVVPLIIEMDREQQQVEFENSQLSALTAPQGQPAK